MSETTNGMARIFDEAIRTVSDKNATYQDAWREHGWRGSLGKVLTKSSRLRNMLWRSSHGLLNGDKEHPRETCIDMINHLTFTVMNMDADREWGHEDVAHVEQQEIRSGQFDHPIRVDGWQPAPMGGLGEPLGPEQTGVMQSVGELGAPGEEPLDENDKPSPTKRQRGRKITDAPQS